MREIKFRAWNKMECKMYYKPYARDEWTTEYQPLNGVLQSIKKDSEYWEPLMQYIGLKDKNGKDIYEGDILEFWPLEKYNKFNLIGKVEFYKYETRFRIVEKIGLGESFWGFSQCEKFYIVGNIYENPELLN